MGPDGIFQFKGQVPVLDPGTAEEDRGLHPHVLDLPGLQHLQNIHPQELMLLILQLQPQGPDLPFRVAHRDHIHRTVSYHPAHLRSFVLL